MPTRLLNCSNGCGRFVRVAALDPGSPPESVVPPICEVCQGEIARAEEAARATKKAKENTASNGTNPKARK